MREVAKSKILTEGETKKSDFRCISPPVSFADSPLIRGGQGECG